MFIDKMRAATACSTCRARKKKCILLDLRPDAACTLCTAKRLPCNVMQTAAQRHENIQHRPHPQPPTAPLLPSSVSSGLSDGLVLPPHVGDELIDIYFDMVHNKQQIAFHRHTFLAERRSGMLPAYLYLGVVALVARFSSSSFFKGSRPCDRATPFLEQAMAAFYQRESQISLHALQGCVLLSFVSSVEGRSHMATLLSAQAMRMAQILRLPDLSSQDPLQRELQIRLYWQLSMMSSWEEGRDGISQPLLKAGVPSPLDDEIFECLQPGQLALAALINERRSGVWASVARLIDTHREIMQLIEMSVAQDHHPHVVQVQIQATSCKLESWISNLPPDLRNSDHNFDRNIALGRGREFTVVHIIYHYQCQLLYYSYLSWDPPNRGEHDTPVGPEALFAARCKQHAVALSQLMWRTNTTPGMECLWSPVNGHLLVVASTILLHTLLFGRNPEQTVHMKLLLAQNYAMMLQLKEYWPTLDLSIRRLHAFHQFCQRDLSTACYKIDAWMVNFLIHFDTPVDALGVGVCRDTATTPGSTIDSSSPQGLFSFVQGVYQSLTFQPSRPGVTVRDQSE